MFCPFQNTPDQVVAHLNQTCNHPIPGKFLSSVKNAFTGMFYLAVNIFYFISTAGNVKIFFYICSKKIKLRKSFRSVCFCCNFSNLCTMEVKLGDLILL